MRNGGENWKHQGTLASHRVDWALAVWTSCSFTNDKTSRLQLKASLPHEGVPMGTYGVTRGRYPMAGLRPWQRSLCSASLLLLRIPCPPSPSPPPLCGIAVESARRRFYLGEKEPQASGARAGDSYSACARGYTKTARGKHQHQPHARTHTYAAQQQEALEYPPIKSHWKLQWVSEHHHKRSARRARAGDGGLGTGGGGWAAGGHPAREPYPAYV